MKTIKTFYNIQPVLDIRVEKTPGPNFGKEYGLNRDRHPDRDWGEYRSTSMDLAKDTELTPELFQILVEDLANYYGENSKLFSELTPELFQILVEDLANYYGENSKLFSEKLKEFGITFSVNS